MNNTTKLVAVVALAAAGYGAYSYFGQANSQANSSEVTAGAAIVSVEVPELTGTAVTGEVIFNKACAACHGANAAGQEGVAPPLVHIIYEPSHHGDMAFQLAAANGVQSHHWRFGNMPPIEGVTQGEVAMIVEYIRQLQRANGIH